MPRFHVLFLGLILMLLAPLVGADDAKLVDNPAYHCWDDAPIGTVVHLAGTNEFQGIAYKAISSRTLTERTPDSLTVENYSTVTEPSGKERRGPSKRLIVPAKKPPDRVNIPDDVDGTATILREETITVAGKNYKCTVIKVEGTMDSGAAKVVSTRWISDDVIGGVVRMETTIEHQGEEAITKLELDSIVTP